MNEQLLKMNGLSVEILNALSFKAHLCHEFKEVLNNMLSGSKDRDAHGCIALKTTHGKHLVELKRELNKAVGYKGVQLVTISRTTAC